MKTAIWFCYINTACFSLMLFKFVWIWTNLNCIFNTGDVNLPLTMELEPRPMMIMVYIYYFYWIILYLILETHIHSTHWITVIHNLSQRRSAAGCIVLQSPEWIFTIKVLHFYKCHTNTYVELCSFVCLSLFSSCLTPSSLLLSSLIYISPHVLPPFIRPSSCMLSLSSAFLITRSALTFWRAPVISITKHRFLSLFIFIRRPLRHTFSL